MLTANPGIKRLNPVMVSRISVPPNKNASRIEDATETSKANSDHHQYSDRLDLVRKSKYLRIPEDID